MHQLKIKQKIKLNYVNTMSQLIQKDMKTFITMVVNVQNVEQKQSLPHLKKMFAQKINIT